MAHHFWDRWLHEYLPSRTVRPMWHCESRDIAEGDLILLMSDNLPRECWPLARVTHIAHSDDGRVRSAEVKTKAGVYIRPVTRLCLLEEVSNPLMQLDTGGGCSRKTEHFVCHVTLRARPLLRPCAFCLSGASW